MLNLPRLVAFLLRVSQDIDKARVTFAWIIGLGILGGLCNTLLIALINTRLSGQGARGLLIGGFVVLCILMPASRLLSNVLLISLTQRAIFSVRMQLCRKILQAPTRHLEELGSHRLLATLTDDVQAIVGALAQVPLFCMHLTIVVGCMLYLAWLSPAGLGIVVAFLVVGIVSYQWPMLVAGRHFDNARTSWNQVFKGFRGLVEGTKELKLHWRRRRDFLTEGLEAPLQELQARLRTANIYATAASSWGQILFFVLIGMVLFLLPGVIGTEDVVLTGYTLTILYMIGPLEVVLNQMPQYRRAQTAIQQVEKLGLSLVSDGENEMQAARESDAQWQSLTLEGVTHTYHREDNDSQFTLGPIDLALRPGEMVFVVGGNGSGKTTLVKLITGLYEPKSGELRLNGRVIAPSLRDRYRQMFTVVFNDFFLFDSLLGLEPSELDQQARHYLEQLHLDHKVSVEGGRLSTVDLSQGQRKRLALLTAYLEDRPIYVFDEWAADQDPYFKEIFYRQLLPELKGRGKTLLVISHDDRYYDLADRVIKLDSGQLVSDQRREGSLEMTPAQLEASRVEV